MQDNANTKSEDRRGQDERERTYAEAQRAAQEREERKHPNRGHEFDDVAAKDDSDTLDFSSLEDRSRLKSEPTEAKPKRKSRGFEIGD